MTCGVDYGNRYGEPCGLPLGHPGDHYQYHLGYTCGCGEYIAHWQVVLGTSGHDQSREHIVGLMRRFDGDDWTKVMQTVEHGFGWAQSESMETGDEDWVGLVVKELIEAWRVASGVAA